MVKRAILSMAAAGALSVAAPGGASAQGAEVWFDHICGGGSLQSCIDFRLSVDAGTYYFKVLYESSLAADAGVVKSTGLYDLSGAPDFDFFNVAIYEAPNASWAAYDEEACNLSGGGVGSRLFEACADRLGDNANVEAGLHVGEWVTFSFTSNLPITAADFMSTRGLGARAHLQSFGEIDCSLKFSSRPHPDYNARVWGDDLKPATDIDQCGSPGSFVPEPMSMVLLATGLVGLGGVAVLRRRREDLLETDHESEA